MNCINLCSVHEQKIIENTYGFPATKVGYVKKINKCNI